MCIVSITVSRAPRSIAPHHHPPHKHRSLLRWLLALASVWGVLCAALAVAVGLADRHALRMGKHPTWPTYRVGLRVLEAIEWARDTMTPPDLRALEMTYAVFDTAIVHQASVEIEEGMADGGCCVFFPSRWIHYTH